MNPSTELFIDKKLIISDNFGGLDRDYINFIVPKGETVKSMILESFTGEDKVAFFALQKNDKYTANDDITLMISYGHFGPGTDDNKIGSDLLYYEKNSYYGYAQREKIELDAGYYTLRVQQGNSSNASYSFSIYLK